MPHFVAETQYKGCGQLSLSRGESPAGVPRHWHLYVAVASPDEAPKKALANQHSADAPPALADLLRSGRCGCDVQKSEGHARKDFASANGF
jgi:hypothetical protein